jgi:hypothetical protein
METERGFERDCWNQNWQQLVRPGLSSSDRFTLVSRQSEGFSSFDQEAMVAFK